MVGKVLAKDANGTLKAQFDSAVANWKGLFHGVVLAKMAEVGLRDETEARTLLNAYQRANGQTELA